MPFLPNFALFHPFFRTHAPTILLTLDSRLLTFDSRLLTFDSRLSTFDLWPLTMQKRYKLAKVSVTLWDRLAYLLLLSWDGLGTIVILALLNHWLSISPSPIFDNGGSFLHFCPPNSSTSWNVTNSRHSLYIYETALHTSCRPLLPTQSNSP